MSHSVRAKRRLHIKIQAVMKPADHTRKSKIETSAAHGITRFICTATATATAIADSRPCE